MTEPESEIDNIEFRDNLNTLLCTFWVYLNDTGDLRWTELTKAQRTKMINFFISNFIQ